MFMPVWVFKSWKIIVLVGDGWMIYGHLPIQMNLEPIRLSLPDIQTPTAAKGCGVRE